MGQAKLPVKCAECPEQGPQRSRAAAEGWLRLSHGGTSNARWVCPSCRVEHERRPEPARRPVPRAARAAVLLALLGVR